MLAFAPHSVCSVRNPVTPGLKMNVMTSLGIRLALGANRVDLMRLVVGNGMKLAVTGTVLGILGAVGAGYALASALFQVRPTDVGIMTSVPLLLLMVALLASYIPARRATRIDPIVVLRQE